MSNGAIDNHGPWPAMRELCNDVLADEYWAVQLRQMASTLHAFDRGIVEELCLDSPTSNNVKNIVRYCIPLFEVHRAIDGVEPDPVWLAAMYLWQEAWRPLDNLLDNDGPLVPNLREYNTSILRAWTFQSSIAPSDRLMEQFLRCLGDTLNAEENLLDRTNPSCIYQRVRLYEVIFDSLPGLSDDTRTNFRNYINAIGIAHDFGDVVTDIKTGISTFVTAALKDIDPHCRLTSSHYQELQAKCKSTFEGQLGKLDSRVLGSCWVTKRNIDAFFKWAF